MTKEKNIKTAVPEFRFPEFEGDGEWKESSIDNEMFYDNGRAHEKNINEGGKYKVVNSKYISTEGAICKFTNEAYCLANKNDVLMVLSDVPNGKAIAKCFIVDKDNRYTVNQRICKLRSKGVNALFLFYIINRNPYFLAFDDGVKQTNLRKENVLNCPLNIPLNPKEQRKIADCLSTLDDLINAVADKIEALKDHKKGLMQKLFPAEGQTVPEFRFPEFEGDGEWKEKTLGKVATFINGRAYKQDELLECGKYRVLRVGNFFSNNKWYYSDLELNDNKFCDKGDLLYAWSASFGPRIWNEEKVIYHYHIWKVIENNNITKDFLYFLLSYETSKIKNHQANGLGLMHITKNSIENWNTFIPKDKKEQQKIADCLSTLDNEIEAQSNKLEELKAHKKGLMQKLFPKI